MQFDDIATQALDLMEKSSANIFLTGKAGTGKSTLLQHFLDTSDKQIAVLAPTGVAALNIGGATIHSFFQLAPDITVDKAREEGTYTKRKDLYQKIDTIIVDEISMVRADLFDCMDVFLQAARNNTAPFGGVQMIMVGDVYQLPPVVTYEEQQCFRTQYLSPYFFDAQVTRHPERGMHTIELSKIYRQTDSAFIEILNAIRTKTIDATQLTKLNEHVTGPIYDIPKGTMYLTGTNKKANIINSQELAKIDEELILSQAEIEGNFGGRVYPTDEILQLKVGAQVMFVANDTKEHQRVNGSLGEVTEIAEKGIMVGLFDDDGDIMDEVFVARHTRNVIRYEYDQKEKKLTTETIGQFIQFPLKLARAVTIHKSQGKTFDKVIFDIDRGMFAHGQSYVALSRCRSLQGLSLVHPLRPRDVITDSRVVEFMGT